MIFPWQQTQWQRCLRQLKQDRLPHAMLMTGVAGLGQVGFAEQLAQYLLCEAPTEAPCHACRQCHLMQQGYHPDYFTINPDDVGKAIKVDQIRQLIGAISQTPQLASRQVVLLAPAEAMNEKAANALLKTLEEPMGDVIFLLVCHQLSSLPITITSRCQQLHFAGCADEEAKNWLHEQTQSPHVATALKLALGAPLLAKTLLDTQAIDLRDQLLQLMLSVSSRGFTLSACAMLAKQPIDRVLYFCRLIYQDMMQAHVGVSQSSWVNIDQAGQIVRLTNNYTVDDCQQQLTQLARLESAYRSRIALNWQLALEGLFVNRLITPSTT